MSYRTKKISENYGIMSAYGQPTHLIFRTLKNTLYLPRHKVVHILNRSNCWDIDILRFQSHNSHHFGSRSDYCNPGPICHSRILKKRIRKKQNLWNLLSKFYYIYKNNYEKLIFFGCGRFSRNSVKLPKNKMAISPLTHKPRT